MNEDKTSAPALITEPLKLQELVEILSQERILAVDTESNSLYAYQEQVCLIQFSTQETDYLVDPLSLDDLSALGPIFTDPKIEKIFHAAEYDLICLKRDFDFNVINLFDTMVAASVLGKAEIGLGSILANEFGVQMDKRYQRANWGQRPLADHLLDYARLDTRYLIPLRNRLKGELEESRRWEMAAEDFTRLSIQNGFNHENLRNHTRTSVEPCWKISGSTDLTPQQAAVLLELCKYRDRVAKQMNRPLFKVIGDSTLHAIASTCPVSINELKRLPGMSQGQVYRHGAALLQAVQRGMEAHPITPPRPPRPDEKFVCRLENLRQWRMRTARDLGVKSDVILSRDLLLAIADRNPRKMSELTEVMKDAPWRLKNYGEEILQVLHCP